MEFDYETHLEDLDERFKSSTGISTPMYCLELSDDEMRFYGLIRSLENGQGRFMV